MKALVIDSASSCLALAARNEALTATVALDMGLSQSQKILTAIDYVLKQVKLEAKDLDFIALTKGPGTFTGLRLSFAAAKALELSNGTPVYGVDSLEAYAWPYAGFDGTVISVIDAKKDQFFARISKGQKVIMESKDTTIEEVLSHINGDDKILTAGPDALLFKDAIINSNRGFTTDSITAFSAQPNATEALFTLGQDMMDKKMPPLADYEGPAYLRKSEAELGLERSQKA